MWDLAGCHWITWGDAESHLGSRGIWRYPPAGFRDIPRHPDPTTLRGIPWDSPHVNAPKSPMDAIAAAAAAAVEITVVLLLCVMFPCNKQQQQQQQQQDPWF